MVGQSFDDQNALLKADVSIGMDSDDALMVSF